MKKLAVVAFLVVLMTAVVIGQEVVKQFRPEKAVVTGIICGSDTSGGAAIIDSSIVFAGETYWVIDGKIGPRIAGKRALKRIPASDRLSVSAVTSAGVTITYRGKTVTRPLKSRKNTGQ